MPTTTAYDLSKTPIHLGDEDTALPIGDFNFDGESFMAYIEGHCQSNPGRLMMIESTPASWATWERHPQGAEIVFVLEGSGSFFQELEDGSVTEIPVQPGAAVINPPGVWHTADITEPMRAIYITPCPDTDHKPR